MLWETLEVSPAPPQPLPAIVHCLRGCRLLQGVLAVANGPRGMAPHLVLQTPGMPSPYMQVRPDCLQADFAGSCVFRRQVGTSWLRQCLQAMASDATPLGVM